MRAILDSENSLNILIETDKELKRLLDENLKCDITREDGEVLPTQLLLYNLPHGDNDLGFTDNLKFEGGPIISSSKVTLGINNQGLANIADEARNYNIFTRSGGRNINVFGPDSQYTIMSNQDFSHQD